MLIKVSRRDKGNTHRNHLMKVVVQKYQSEVKVAEFELDNGGDGKENLPEGDYLLKVVFRGRQLFVMDFSKARSITLAFDELIESSGKANNSAVPEHQGKDAGKHVDPSTVVDRKQLEKGLLIVVIGFELLVVGSMLANEGIKRSWFDSFFWIALLLVPGGAVAFIGVIQANMSGYFDKRCKKCNSNRLQYTESTGRYLGTYSQQQRVYNLQTKRPEFARVIKTDFEYDGITTCLLCGAKEVSRIVRTTNSN